jgi:hypothetical protein
LNKDEGIAAANTLLSKSYRKGWEI